MAGNLVKGGYVLVNSDNKKVIDNNEVIRRRIEEMQELQAAAEARNQQEEDDEADEGFTEGLNPLAVEMLVSDGNENIIGGDTGDITGADMPLTGGATDADFEETNEECNRMLQEARIEAEAIKADAEATGYDEGYNKGVNEAFPKLEAEYNEKVKALEADYEDRINAITGEYENLKNNLEPLLVDKITDIYEHVLGISLSDSRDTVLKILKRSLEEMESGRNYIIHVSREDYPDIRQSKDYIAEGTGIMPEMIDIIEDNSVVKNGCIIESDCGIFDCGLGTQMELLKKQLAILSYE